MSMRRGPAPTPAEIDDKRGNPSGRAKPRTPDTIGALQAEAPAHVTGRGVAAIWERVAADLQRLNFVKVTDQEALGRYCRMLALWQKVSKRLDREALTYETDSNHGKMKRQNPSFSVYMMLEKRLMEFENVFGLNPAARQRIMAGLAAGAERPRLPLPGDEQQQPAASTPEADDNPVGWLRPGSEAIN